MSARFKDRETKYSWALEHGSESLPPTRIINFSWWHDLTTWYKENDLCCRKGTDRSFSSSPFLLSIHNTVLLLKTFLYPKDDLGCTSINLLWNISTLFTLEIYDRTRFCYDWMNLRLAMSPLYLISKQIHS